MRQRSTEKTTKRMKHRADAIFVAILLITAMIMGLTACGTNNSNDEKSGGKEGTEITDPGSQGSSGQDSSGNQSGQGSQGGSSQGSQGGGNQGTPDGSSQGGQSSGSEVSKLSLEGVVAMPSDGVGTPGIDFQLLETGPVQGWDETTPAPFFNPLGDRALYSDAYASNGAQRNSYEGLDVIYFDEDGITPIKFSVYGQRYDLVINNSDVSRNWLIYMAKQQGAEVLPTTNDMVVFSLKEDESSLWWVVCNIDRSDASQVDINICRVNTHPSGKTVTINTEDTIYDESYDTYYFYTKCVPGKQQSMTVSFSNTWDDAERGIYLIASKEIDYGQLRYDIEKYMDDDVTCPRKGEVIRYDDIPVVDGWLEWQLKLEMGDLPSTDISITLNDIEDIPAIDWSENPGLVKIIDAPEGGGAFLTMNNGYFWHPEVAEDDLNNFYRDEDGNYCVVAPCGYYTLNIGGDAISGIDNSGKMTNVPVSSGKITEVTIPRELSVTYSDLMATFRDADSEAGGIEIQSVKDNGDTATVNITVFDPFDREVLPAKEDFSITENGLDGSVTKIERVPGKADVVLCMDSSGSMRKSMDDALAAAKRFVQSLPENSTIHVIQFEQEIIPHNGSTKEEAIVALSSIKAGGDTSMYDAVDQAITYLNGSKKPYIVVFSDGADSREPGVGGTGSALSKEEICTRIKEAGVTLLTIGFGAGHDPKALVEMSKISVDGAYYVAADKTALDTAFAAVTTKFGNQFVITYKRPTATINVESDVPVVSMMLDVSGSMNEDPVEYPDDDVDYRIDRIKSIFHNFVSDMPQGTLMQLSSFCSPFMAPPKIMYEQLTTTRKADIYRAIGSVEANGGTPIIQALEASLNELTPILSSKKVLVFFTDAALEVWDDGSGAQKMQFEEIIQKIKDSGIRVLFAGLGGTEYAKEHEGTFKTAADLAGGDYIITSSVEDIAKKLDELLLKINTPIVTDKKTTALMIELDCKTEDGSRMKYTASKDVSDLSAKTTTGKAAAPGIVSTKIAGPFIRYDKAGSSLLYGNDSPVDDSVIVNRETFDEAEVSNKFASLKVKEAYYMTKFKGLEKYDSMFIALNVELTYKKADSSSPEIGYQIPSIFDHFYVSYNQERMMPASKLTWLSEQPFSNPGDPSVTVMQKKDDKGNVLPEGETKSGILIFEVHKSIDEDTKQLSLHFYDVTYGHMEIPLYGSMPERLLSMSALPKEEPQKISDAFSMEVTGKNDTTELAGTDVNEYSNSLGRARSVFRTLEANFTSNVQALLRIEPDERFYYKITTDSGDLLSRMSPIVQNIPLGFTGDTMFAPASANIVQLPYVIPEKLKTASASIWGELNNGTFDVPVQKGDTYTTGSNKTSFEHEYFTLIINDLALIEKGSDKVVLDFTVKDKKDGEGTGGFDSILMLKKDPSKLNLASDIEHLANGMDLVNAIKSKGLGDFGDTNDVFDQLGVCEPDFDDTRSLIYGASYADKEWGAYDGQSRRGILIFSLDSDESVKDWELQCSMIPSMKVKISTEAYKSKDLLAMVPVINVEQSFEEAKEAKVSAAIDIYNSTHPEASEVKEIGLSSDEIVGDHVASPLLTAYGKNKIESVKTIQDFYDIMDSLIWMPEYKYMSFYSPQSVITQGWGTDSDFYELAATLLSRLGYQPKERMFIITETGKANLERLGGFTGSDVSTVRAIAYTDEGGKPHVYVPAFRREANELGGLGMLSFDNPDSIYANTGHIQVAVSGELTGEAGAAAQSMLMADMGGFLTGSDEGNPLYETISLLDADFDFIKAGEDFIDVSFLSVGKSPDGIHDLITAVADSNAGFMTSPNNWIDTSNYNIDRITITISSDYTPKDKAEHTIFLKEGEKLTDIFQSFAFCVPELCKEAATEYEKLVSEYAKDDSNTNYGTARWFTHATLSRMISTLGEADDELCERLKVQSGRTNNQMLLCSTLRSNGTDAVGSVDIMNIKNNLYPTVDGNESEVSFDDCANSYNVMLGFFASQAEANVLPDGQGKSYMDVWATLPDDAGFITVNSESEEQQRAAAALEEAGFPAFLIERLRLGNDSCGYLIPTKAGIINGEERWAWLEINTYTNEVVSVFDTGERSGMAGFVLGLTPKSAVEFTAGALVGIACSHFSIASYALEIEDYEDIMKCSEKLMIYTYERLKQMQSGMDEAKAWVTDPVGKAKDTLNDAVKERTSIDVNDLYEKFKDGYDGEGEPPEPTFVDGFKVIVEAYFGVTIE